MRICVRTRPAQKIVRMVAKGDMFLPLAMNQEAGRRGTHGEDATEGNGEGTVIAAGIGAIRGEDVNDDVVVLGVYIQDVDSSALSITESQNSELILPRSENLHEHVGDERITAGKPVFRMRCVQKMDTASLKNMQVSLAANRPLLEVRRRLPAKVDYGNLVVHPNQISTLPQMLMEAGQMEEVLAKPCRHQFHHPFPLPHCRHQIAISAHRCKELDVVTVPVLALKEAGVEQNVRSG